MLVVFLPTLLFESAFAMDYAVFRKQFTQIVLLAVCRANSGASAQFSLITSPRCSPSPASSSPR